MNRRSFLKQVPTAGLLAATLPSLIGKSGLFQKAALFHISLSQWSFNRAIFGKSREDYPAFLHLLHNDPDAVLTGGMDPRDIVLQARKLGVDAVDLVNILWFGHGTDKAWLAEFNRRAAGEGVEMVCLMCDELGNIGASEKSIRTTVIERHVAWMETAATLGCSQFRVNPYGDGTYLAQMQQCAESLQILAERAQEFELELLVENHGHPGGNGAWMSMLIEMSNHPNLGILADFDNFFMGGWGIEPERRYDREQGMLDLAPHTRAVSAKAFSFNEDGSEQAIDFDMCMRILLDEGFRGWVSAEYEGFAESEYEGAQKTISLLKRLRGQLEKEYE